MPAWQGVVLEDAASVHRPRGLAPTFAFAGRARNPLSPSLERAEGDSPIFSDENRDSPREGLRNPSSLSLGVEPMQVNSVLSGLADASSLAKGRTSAAATTASQTAAAAAGRPCSTAIRPRSGPSLPSTT